MLKFVFVILVGCLPLRFCQAESHHPQEFLKAVQGTKDEASQIVQHFCASCHAAKPMIQLGAPTIGQEDEWKSRVKQGIHTLLQHTTEGLNAMPARGGCFECSDEQLILAILAMLPECYRKISLIELKDDKKSI
jgi:cytochrome c5